MIIMSFFGRLLALFHSKVPEDQAYVKPSSLEKEPAEEDGHRFSYYISSIGTVVTPEDVEKEKEELRKLSESFWADTDGTIPK